MRSNWVTVGPKPNDICLIKWEKTEKERQGKHGNRDESDAATNQGMTGIITC